jgi:hypothetical protein
LSEMGRLFLLLLVIGVAALLVISGYIIMM